MSLYSNLSNKIICDGLISQYDFEKKYPNCENQCSWYVYCVIDYLKNNQWEVPIESEKIRQLHDICLDNASKMRSVYGKLSWGESIFSKTIQTKFDFPIGSPRTIQIGDCTSNNYLCIKHMEDIINFKIGLPNTPLSEFHKKLCEMYYTNTYIFVNRHGQSFLIYPNGFGEFIIFDSHVRSIGIFNTNSVIRYILNNSTDNLVTFIIGYRGNTRLNNITFDDE